ncbi:hypothetical protein E5Z46_06100 [Geobacillus kaustophilus NBRC 102445]|uniref:hypothetical protein n=1 Tax=Geobacillus thermoleovorans group TaxID=1505648 RepID=UPI0005A5E94A|nr:hypothetical protein [Geobacillus kaustophilus]MED4973664.1 hypothetical protein [Geobacillus thermoleovorans]QCK81884.1 hypothetical protein E5Z46_06100 [Geobacillus kaustophilus NBRC 102445]
MLVEEAKKRIEYLQDYIRMIESYTPTTMEEEAVYLYVQLESVTKVVQELNRKGYRIGKRKLTTVDVSNIIRSKPKDEMHELAKQLFTKNRKRGSWHW